MRLAAILFAMSLVLGLGACSGDSVCSGTNCTCPAGDSCDFDGCSKSTTGCNYVCGSDSTCSGDCGADCNVACSGKTCTHEVGEGSLITCTAGTCNITCNGTCTVAGSANLTCVGSTKGVTGCD